MGNYWDLEDAGKVIKTVTGRILLLDEIFPNCDQKSCSLYIFKQISQRVKGVIWKQEKMRKNRQLQ